MRMFIKRPGVKKFITPRSQKAQLFAHLLFAIKNYLFFAVEVVVIENFYDLAPNCSIKLKHMNAECKFIYEFEGQRNN